jgi:hypothetical protein
VETGGDSGGLDQRGQRPVRSLGAEPVMRDAGRVVFGRHQVGVLFQRDGVQVVHPDALAR